MIENNAEYSNIVWHIALESWHRLFRAYGIDHVIQHAEGTFCGMDDISIDTLRSYLRRIAAIPDFQFSKYIRVNYQRLKEDTVTDWERREIQRCPNLPVEIIKERYKLDETDDIYIRPETFLYHSGLSLIPNARSRILARDVIDGGAFHGETALIIREHYSPSHIFSFEPDPQNYAVLERTLKRNFTGQGIVPLAAGLGKNNGVINLKPFGHGSHRVDIPANGTLQCPVFSIDVFSAAHNLDVACIKLDVEGLEYEVILGAKDTIIRHKPILLISVYHGAKDLLEILPLIRSWNLDYTYMLRHLHPHFSTYIGEYMLIAY